MVWKNTGVYNSEKQYKEVIIEQEKLKREIQNALIANAPTPEIKNALIIAAGRV